MKTLRYVGVALLILIAAISFLYLNYCPEVFAAGELTLDPEMTDVEISKFIIESLKKVIVSTF